MSVLDLYTRIAARLRVRTRYTRALEDEIARLRAENRALVNSILGVAGMPPVRAAAIAGRLAHSGALNADLLSRKGLIKADGLKSTAVHRPAPQDPTLRAIVHDRRSGWGTQKDERTQAENRLGEPECEAEPDGERIAPLRRRSWQQIGRLREIEDARAARRERETDTKTFPTPRQIVPRV